MTVIISAGIVQPRRSAGKIAALCRNYARAAQSARKTVDKTPIRRRADISQMEILVTRQRHPTIPARYSVIHWSVLSRGYNLICLAAITESVAEYRPSRRDFRIIVQPRFRSPHSGTGRYFAFLVGVVADIY